MISTIISWAGSNNSFYEKPKAVVLKLVERIMSMLCQGEDKRRHLEAGAAKRYR